MCISNSSENRCEDVRIEVVTQFGSLIADEFFAVLDDGSSSPGTQTRFRNKTFVNSVELKGVPAFNAYAMRFFSLNHTNLSASVARAGSGIAGKDLDRGRIFTLLSIIGNFGGVTVEGSYPMHFGNDSQYLRQIKDKLCELILDSDYMLDIGFSEIWSGSERNAEQYFENTRKKDMILRKRIFGAAATELQKFFKEKYGSSAIPIPKTAAFCPDDFPCLDTQYVNLEAYWMLTTKLVPTNQGRNPWAADVYDMVEEFKLAMVSAPNLLKNLDMSVEKTIRDAYVTAFGFHPESLVVVDCGGKLGKFRENEQIYIDVCLVPDLVSSELNSEMVRACVVCIIGIVLDLRMGNISKVLERFPCSSDEAKFLRRGRESEMLEVSRKAVVTDDEDGDEILIVGEFVADSQPRVGQKRDRLV